MAGRSQAKLLAQGKQRMLGGAERGWRVRLYAPAPGSNNYTPGSNNYRCSSGLLPEKASRGSGCCGGHRPRRRPARSSQAEAALDTEQPAPASAPVRASRTIEALGAKYIEDSQTARQGATHHRGTRVPAQRAHPPDHRRRAGDEVARRAQPQGDGEGRQDALLPARPRGPPWPARRNAQARPAARLARSQHRPARRPGDREGQRPARSDSAVRRPTAASRDPARSARWPRRPTSCVAPRAPTRG